jgi:diguanylate cyclase (GGDEF)-like protein/PAS domain S-box-containing protein
MSLPVPLPAAHVQDDPGLAETRYRRLLTQVQAIVLECTPEGRILFANHVATRVLGGPCVKTLVGRSACDLFPGARTAQFDAFAGLFARRADLRAQRLTMVTWTGETRVVEWSTANHYDRDGRLTKVVGLGIDCTERDATERALRDVEERFRASMDALLTGIFIHRDGRFRYVNGTACDMLGYEPHELVEVRGPLDVIAPHHHARVEQAIRERVAGLPAIPFVIEFVRKDGSTFVGRVFGRRVQHDSSGSPDIVVSVHDITDLLNTQAALAESERMARSTLNGLSAQVCIVDLDGNIVAVNDAWREFARSAGADPATVHEGTNYFAASRCSHCDRDLQVVMAGFRSVASGEQPLFRMEYRCHGPQRRRWVELRITPFPGDGPRRLIVAHEDITELRLAQRSAQINECGIEHAGIAAFRANTAGQLVHVNAAACEMLGYTREELLRLRVQDVNPHIGDDWERHAARARESGSRVYETEHRARDGSVIPVEVAALYVEFDGEAHYLGYAKDLRARRKVQQHVERLMNFDPLTGLPNRHLLLDRLTRAVKEARARGRGLVVLDIDIDEFHRVNDSMGHGGGDVVLVTAARRLAQAVCTRTTIARPGGGRFIAFCDCERAAVSDVGRELAQRMLGVFAEPFTIGAQHVFLTCCVGVATFPTEGDDADTLLRNAGTAVHQAKEAGRGEVRHYNYGDRARSRDWLMLEADLRRALAEDQLELEYQPQIDLRSGRVYAVEALLRWQHPTLGLVLPERIIPLAEETGLIGRIGEWVLRHACAQAMAWKAGGVRPVGVSVNVSAYQVHGSDFVDIVRGVLHDTGLAPELLELELTETMLLQDLDRALETFHALHALGVRLALDDFGTGYSSLRYLRLCPFDTIKIDRSFVHDATATPEEASITRAVINMTHALNLKVVAEGVETEGQLALLLAYQCDAIQGYYFSAPRPARELEALLREDWRLALDKVRANGRQRTLLLVDDEENILSALRRLLRKDGYEILAARSAQEALMLLARHDVDVIVSDQRMPVMSGVEFLRRAKELFPDTIRMVLSGFTELQSITDAINEGAIYKFLTKPWDDEQLREHVAEAFRNKELADENRRLQHALRVANSDLADVNAALQAAVNGQRSTIDEAEASIALARELLRAVPVPVLAVDAEGCVTFSNDEADALLPADARGDGRMTIDAVSAHLARAVVSAAAEATMAVDIDGRPFRALVRGMGVHGGGRGRLIALMPECHGHG